VLILWRNQMLRRFVIRQAHKSTEQAVKYALMRGAQRRFTGSVRDTRKSRTFGAFGKCVQSWDFYVERVGQLWI
jgi:hypothetical protein